MRNPGSSPSWDALKLATLIWGHFANGSGSSSCAGSVGALLCWEKWEDLCVGLGHGCGLEEPCVGMEVVCRAFWVSAICFIQGFHLPTLLKVCIGSFKIKNALCGAGIQSQKGMSRVNFIPVYVRVRNVSDEAHETSFLKKSL